MVIDARPTGGAGAGPGIDIDSPDVVVEGLSIWNVAFGNMKSGNGIRSLQAGLVIEGCKLRSNEAEHVIVIGDDLRVSHSTFSGGTSLAVFATGANARIVDCKARNTAGLARIIGENAVVDHCQADFVAGTFVLITGHAARVTKSSVRGAKTRGVDITGDDAEVSGCDLTGIQGEGIVVAGNGTTLRGNDIQQGAGGNLVVTGDLTIVDKNHLTGGTDGGALLGSDAVVSKNRFDAVGGYCINIDGENPQVVKNTCRDTVGGDPAIYVTNA